MFLVVVNMDACSRCVVCIQCSMDLSHVWVACLFLFGKVYPALIFTNAKWFDIGFGYAFQVICMYVNFVFLSFVQAKYVIVDMLVAQQPALPDLMFHLGLYQLA